MSLTPNDERLIKLVKDALEDPSISPETASDLREEWATIISGCWLDEEDDGIQPEPQ